MKRSITWVFTVAAVALPAAVSAQQAILMTDFGVQPPTAMLGLLKTKNEVTIIYDLVADYEKIETALSSRPVSGAQEG